MCYFNAQCLQHIFSDAPPPRIIERKLSFSLCGMQFLLAENSFLMLGESNIQFFLRNMT